jgi:hypothetical protein
MATRADERRVILEAMDDDELHLIGPDEIAYRLDLTPEQLKIVHSALHSMLDDLGHDERDVQHIVREVLDKLPDEHSIRAIDIRRR